MRKTVFSLFSALGLVLVSPGLSAQATFNPGFLIAEYYMDIGSGTSVDDLRAAPKFPNNPDEVKFLGAFEIPIDYADNYGVRVSGFFVPETTGNYVFFISSDDGGELYLSTDDNPANKHLIAIEPQWQSPRNWTSTERRETFFAGYPDNRSDTYWWTEWPDHNTITLTAGTRYYIEALMKEGDGGDNLAVTVKLENEPDPEPGSAPLSGSRIGAMIDATGASLNITQQPAAVTVQEERTATFRAQAQVSPPEFPIAYQWFRNGEPIAGAIDSSFTTDDLTLAESGVTFKVVLSTVGNIVVESQEVTLTVVPDTFPPEILSARAIRRQGGDWDIGVIFDEPIQTGAEVQANYSLSGGTITGVRYIRNSSGIESKESGVVVSATGLTAGETHTLTVSNLADAKGNAMTPTDRQFTTSGMTWASLGRVEEFEPAVFPVGERGFNLLSGGAGFWNINDDITFVYEEITGDFDKVGRVEYQDPSSQWARAGIHARETLIAEGDDPETGASRHQTSHVTPWDMWGGTQPAQRTYEVNRRLNTGGETSASGGGGSPTYPNSWVRLKRDGQVFTMFRSSDGQEWTEMGTTDFEALSETPLPDTLMVGPVYGPENANIGEESIRQLWAMRIRDYADFGDIGEAQETTLTISLSADNIIIGWDPNVGRLESASTITGPWEPVGTQNPATIAILSGQNRFYRVVAP